MWLPMIQSNLKVKQLPAQIINIMHANNDSVDYPVKSSRLPCGVQHLSAGLQLRLQAIQNRVNRQCLQGQAPGAPPFALRKWLQCTQFKMAQVEIQSSEAASQFYPM